jgi:HEAT repeat protein
MYRSLVLGLACSFLSLPAAAQQPPKKEDMPRFLEKLSAKDAKVRLAAVETIAELGEIKAAYAKDAIDPLLDVLKQDEDAKVREATALALQRIDADAARAVPGLLECLKTDGEEAVVLASIASLGYYGSASKEGLPLMKERNSKYMEEVAKLKEEEAKARADGDKEKLLMFLRKGNAVRQKSQIITTAMRSIDPKAR